MHHWPARASLLLWAALLGAGTGTAYAQPDNQPAAPTPAAPSDGAAAAPAAAASGAGATPAAGQTGADQARNALKKQAGDVDQTTNLKDTLTKSERQYSLLKQGKIESTYTFNYSYTGSEAIAVGYSSNQAIDLFKIENTRAHTLTNEVEVDFGLLNNLTLTGTLPLVAKFTQSDTFNGVTTDIGDISLGARFQPFEQTRSAPSLTLNGTLSLPTGRSPFRVIQGSNLSTGAGYTSATLGVNASQVLDPVALFGSFSVTMSGDATGLHQVNQADGSMLTKVHPGLGLGFGAGFTYALSYDISTTVSFTENVTSSSRISWNDSTGTPQTPRATTMQVAGLLNLGLGVRLNPKTTVSLSAGIGLTTDSPNFSLTANVPVTFPGL